MRTSNAVDYLVEAPSFDVEVTIAIIKDLAALRSSRLKLSFEGTLVTMSGALGQMAMFELTEDDNMEVVEVALDYVEGVFRGR